MGITSPTPIQRLSVGPVLKRKDIIAKAETGTGKTLAFGAGMVSLIDPTRATVLGLVLCPTRELALQVHDVLKELGDTRGIKSCLIVGGDPPQPQVKALQNGAQLVVGTPGRVMDLYNQGFLSFPWTEFVVLDEADEMLEIGFIDDIKKILSYTPDERTTLLFSATFPPALLRLARDYTTDPLEIATAKGVATVDHISQNWMKVNDDDKWLALTRLIENSAPEETFLVFGDRRTDVDQLIRKLERMPFPCKALHGGYDQASRTRVMTAFRAKEVKCLVATDVASRGLDVKHVSHVINFGVPRDVSTYTHRIGRTGRAGAKGTAITMVTRRDHGRWTELSGQMNWGVELIELPERSGRGGRDRGRGRSEDRRPRRDSQERTSRTERPERTERPKPAEDKPTRQERSAEGARHVRGEPVRKSTRRRDSEREEKVTDEPREERRPRRARKERSDSSNERSDSSNGRSDSSNERSNSPSEASSSRSGERQPMRQERGKPVRKSTRRRETEREPEVERSQERETKGTRKESSDSSSAAGRDREERPKMPRHKKPAAQASSGFGDSVDDAPRKPQPKTEEPKREPRAPKPKSPAEPLQEPQDTGGFGAGI